MPVRESLELLFVIGPARSGTTLLAALLSQDNISAMLPECTIITSALVHRLNYLSVASDRYRYEVYATDDDTLDAYYRQFVDSLISNAAIAKGEWPKSRLVLKDPELCLIAEHIHRFSTRPMRSVCIVRDPRDVIASMYEVRRREGQALPELELIISYAKAQYNGLIRAVEHPSPSNPIFLMRYEDLVCRDPNIIDKLSAFCGFRIDIDKFNGIPESELLRDTAFFKETLTGPVSSRRVRAYAEVLSPDQLHETEEAFRDILMRFDYQLSSGFRRARELEKQVYEKSIEIRELATTLEEVKQKLHESYLDRNELTSKLASSQRVIEAMAAERDLARVELSRYLQIKSSAENRQIELETSLQVALQARDASQSSLAAVESDLSILDRNLKDANAAKRVMADQLLTCETTCEKLRLEVHDLRLLVNAMTQERNAAASALGANPPDDSETGGPI